MKKSYFGKKTTAAALTALAALAIGGGGINRLLIRKQRERF